MFRLFLFPCSFHYLEKGLSSPVPSECLGGRGEVFLLFLLILVRGMEDEVFFVTNYVGLLVIEGLWTAEPVPTGCDGSSVRAAAGSSGALRGLLWQLLLRDL